MHLTTDRLLIRPWQSRDKAAFADINADPEVRRYFYPSLLTRTQSDADIERCMRHLDEHGFAFLALERKEDKVLIGGAGLSWAHDIPGVPAIEIGWILGRPFWRQRYAREVGLAWFAHGWSLGFGEIVGYTSKINLPSRAQMEALGMTCDPADDFADPTVPTDNPLSPHALYRIRTPHNP